jgi:catechol 2,3-dioxygenase-like lactoylglutathione lyase family enzyme
VDLERALGFYRDLLGMNVVAREPFEGSNYEAIMALPKAKGTSVLLTGGSLTIELFEFVRTPTSSSDSERPISKPGISHFCIEVADVDEAYERLRTAGVPFHSPPLAFHVGKATYGRDPDGNVFELLERRRGGRPSRETARNLGAHDPRG